MENYIVSARKYRPATFETVIGQKALTTTLINAIQGNKLANAYLFFGPRGIGKTTCARIFAKTINCEHRTAAGEACNECESCVAFNQQRSLNIHELDAASNNSVDDIRALTEQVRIPHQIGKYKVYIIDEVHMLSQQAFNAFLKTLEEPPHHAIFILATTEKHKVIPTILSRCQVFDFSRITVTDIVAHLKDVAQREGIEAEPEALNVIALKADGGMRDALSIFDQVAIFSGGKITYKAVLENLNVLDYEYYFRLTDLILRGDVRSCMLTLDEILQKGFDGQHLISGLSSHFRDLLVSRDEVTLKLLEIGSSIRERYGEMAKRCPEAFLYQAIKLANDCDFDYRASRNKRLLLELTLIRLCQLTDPDGLPEEKKKSLKPIEVEVDPVDTSAEKTEKQEAEPAVQDNVVREPESVYVPAPTPTPTPPEPQSDKLAGITSINHTPTAEDTIITEQPQVVTTADSPFTEEQLVACWDEYSESIAVSKAHLKNTMLNCKPTHKEGFTYEIIVYNPVQKDELLNENAELLQALRERLQNSNLQLIITVDDTREKKLVYTDTEKFEFLNNINGALTDLQNAFGLTFV
ncbi:MAG: DNA polymerase III subunit gamma/tau [Tannerella sp.]|jgi:DNA polymerase-3 subunit gamma/tau|nr:DNA polymerase III subunit gamma/tau [Tannerella sp.]